MLDVPPTSEQQGRSHLKIDWLPDIVTSIGLLLGCLSLLSAFDGRFERAAILIYACLVCDVLDGLVARASHVAAPFGAEYDSLSDVVAFGVAPAGLVYSWALKTLGPWGLFVFGPFVVSSALRLARFNVQTATGQSSKRRFVGLPVPGAAAVIAGLFFGFELLPRLSTPALCVFFSAVMLILAGLMVSRIPYPLFKVTAIRDYAARLIAIAVGVVILLAIAPRLSASIAAIAYLVSGPVLALRGDPASP
jgi:CDP-diacylglycerol---serine O-phosphatidyltransferase